MHYAGKTGKAVSTGGTAADRLGGVKRLARLVVAAAMLTASSSILACGASSGSSFVHRALPAPLPAGVVIAEVQFPVERTAEFFRVRVLRMIQGAPAATLQLASLGRRTSCDEFIEPDTRGFVMGRLIGMDRDVPVIDPIRVDAFNGYRLPDGFQVSPPSAQRDSVTPY